MTQVTANGLSFEVETLGKPTDPAILLIMGLGMQLVTWPDEFCAALADAGYYVIRFDNRDIGLSSKITGGPRSNLFVAFMRNLFRMRVHAAYSLNDMAADSVGILDALGVPAAHIVGASMGGMIAQQIAANYPQRTLSLVSIMSSSGARHLPRPTPEAMAVMLKRPARGTSFDKLVDHYVHLFHVIGSPGYRTPEPIMRARMTQILKRSYNPGGTVRQLLAIVAAGDRSSDLARINTPTLVIHGADDPLIRLACGEDCAKKIRGARLMVVPGMGHDFASGLMQIIANAIIGHARQTDSPKAH